MLPTLTDDDLREFQVLWKKETGKDIDLPTAREYAGNIIGLVALVCRVEKQNQT